MLDQHVHGPAADLGDVIRRTHDGDAACGEKRRQPGARALGAMLLRAVRLCGLRHAQRPLNCGWRFSRKAMRASRASSVLASVIVKSCSKR
ncbi:hypothetical protein D3C85_1794220 [compost metagenome]